MADFVVSVLQAFYERMSVMGVVAWVYSHWYLVLLGFGMVILAFHREPAYNDQAWRAEEKKRGLFVRFLLFLSRLLVLAVGIFVLILLYMMFSTRF